MLKFFQNFIVYLHDHILTLSAIAAMLIVATFCGCLSPQVENPIKPGSYVTATELQMSYHTWRIDCNAVTEKFSLASDELRRQQSIYDAIGNQIIEQATSGNVSITSILLTLLSAGGVGAIADNIRMRIDQNKKS
jgi:hypothetical protein